MSKDKCLSIVLHDMEASVFAQFIKLGNITPTFPSFSWGI